MYRRLSLSLAVGFLSIASLAAQVRSTVEVDTLSLQGVRIDNPEVEYTRPVSKIIADVKITGAPSYDEFVLKSLSSLAVGERIDIPGLALTDAVKRYMQYGYFANAKILITKYVGDYAWIEIQLVENPRIGKVTYTGIGKSDREELEKRIGLRKGMQSSPNVFDRTRQLIKKYFDEKGYREMKLTINQQPSTEEKNFIDLIIHIDKSGKTKIKNIIFEGNEALTDHQLRMAMKKTNETFSTKRLWTSILEIFQPKKLVDAELENDLQNLLKRYHQAGYRDAEIVSDSIVRLQDGSRKVDLHIKLHEGNKYYIKDIRFVGNTKYNAEVLNHLLGVKAGDLYDQKRLEDRLQVDEDAVSNLYYNNGYIFAAIDPVETSVVGDSVSLDIRITEGPQATINKVKISGNDIVYEDVVRRELYTKPGRLFSKEDLMNSYRLINQIGHFDAEKSLPKTVPDPANGTVDIEYDLVPKSNDQLNLSIGWSQSGLIGSAGFTFSNFSIKNLFRPSMYKGIIPQGDGQKLSINVQSNARYYHQASLSFSDPWFGGKRPNLFSVSAFYSHSTAIDQRYYSNQVNSYMLNNPYYLGGYGYGNGYGYGGYGGYGAGYGYGGSSAIYESAYDSDKSLTTLGLTIGNGRRLNWPDNWFQVYGALNYTHYRLNNWIYYTFGNFHHGRANDINLELRLERNSIDNPIYTRRGSEFSVALNLTPPYSAFDGKDYSDPALSEADRYRFIEYHKWRFSGKVFLPLLNPLTVKRTPVLMARMDGGIISSYNKHKRSPFGTYYMGGDMMSGQYAGFTNETISLRGYRNGSIAGADYDYAYSYFRTTLELRYPLIFEQSTTIWVLGFLEAGNAWRDNSRYNPFDLKRSAGVGVRIMLPMVGLLGIDWAYGFDRPSPLSRERGGSNVHFVLGRDI
ncbi:outer membrane protein assembly factor [Porphyromonas sp. COT-290 OH860]|uniref:BamA/OMP85 family outer membrane protein n=1 Tax=Porphyromonas sp. COT-290 OH860 TaxID=1515615 RepID=UPI00052B8585|nr:POTRA domain-containing protein [Porphyromonas sp. COT-290 OH860]KGN85044.1 membrane protein [Porphyromonas sp. COT-290 OH860]